MRMLLVMMALLWGVAAAQCLLPEKVGELLRDGKAMLLDVREPSEIQQLGSVPGFVNIPLGELGGRLAELPHDKLILTA